MIYLALGYLWRCAIVVKSISSECSSRRLGPEHACAIETRQIPATRIGRQIGTRIFEPQPDQTTAICSELLGCWAGGSHKITLFIIIGRAASDERCVNMDTRSRVKCANGAAIAFRLESQSDVLSFCNKNKLVTQRYE